MSNDILRRLRDLRTTKQHITPDAAWVRATRETLLMQVKNNLPLADKATFFGRVRGAFNAFMPRNVGSWMHRPMIAMLFLLAVLTGGSIVSVSAAEQALPGDLLYSLKLATEQARLAFTPVVEDRLKLKTEFNARRVNELRHVADDTDHPNRVVQVAEILKSDLNTLKQQLDEVVQGSSAQNAAAAAKLVDKKTTEVISALQETKAQLSPANKEKITEAQSAAADTSVKAIEVLANTHTQKNDAVSAADIEEALKDHAKAVSTVTTDSVTLSSSTSMLLPASTSTTQILTDIASSSTVSTASTTLPALIGQVKDATTQAFAQQKMKDQLAVSGASSTAMLPAGSSSSSTGLPLTSSSTTSTPTLTPSSTVPTSATGTAPK